MTATTTATTAAGRSGASYLFLSGALLVGTALIAIVLSRQGGAGTFGAGRAGALAGAFGTTFWVAAGPIDLAVVPALLLLPRPRPRMTPA